MLKFGNEITIRSASAFDTFLTVALTVAQVKERKGEKVLYVSLEDHDGCIDIVLNKENLNTMIDFLTNVKSAIQG